MSLNLDTDAGRECLLSDGSYHDNQIWFGSDNGDSIMTSDIPPWTILVGQIFISLAAKIIGWSLRRQAQVKVHA